MEQKTAVRSIIVEEADRHVTKEVVLDVNEEEYESLRKCLKNWYNWRKINLAKGSSTTNQNLFDSSMVGPVLYKRDGEYILRVNRWIGSISGRGIIIELKPKFPVKAALNIVCANALHNFGEFSAPPHLQAMTETIGEEEMGFVVAYLLISYVEEILKIGLRATYKSKDQCTMQTKGKILITKQMSKQKGLLFPVHCRVQIHTYDSLENQFIKAALKRIMYLIRNNCMKSYDEKLLDQLFRKLKDFLYQFEQFGVSDTMFTYDNIPKFHFHKLNKYYQPACSICSVILSNSSTYKSLSNYLVPNESNDSDHYHNRNHLKSNNNITGSCWIYNMANEFEQFVRDSLRRSDRLSTLSKGHVDWSMMKNQVHMEPDLVLDNRTLIGDVKYRKYSHVKRRPDIFQVLAYSNTKIATLQDVVLVYASVDNLFLKQMLSPQFSSQSFSSCEEFCDFINVKDIRENIFLSCKQCSIIIDLLCSWDFEKRIWCCCLDLPNSTHVQLIQQISHIQELLEKHLP